MGQTKDEVSNLSIPRKITRVWRIEETNKSITITGRINSCAARELDLNLDYSQGWRTDSCNFYPMNFPLTDNMMILEDRAGTYTPKIIDFGDWSEFTGEDDTVSVPKSWPWSAPEHKGGLSKPSLARKMVFFHSKWCACGSYMRNTSPESCPFPLEFIGRTITPKE